MSGSRNTTETGKRILMVVASPAVSSTLGWPVGFWASELTHPYKAFNEAGYEIDLASPQGGKVELDALSDPRHESGYSASDTISLEFLNAQGMSALLENTKKLSDVRAEDYDAIVVCGGQSPMFTFRDDKTLQSLIASFYESGKPTAALCHGVASLIDTKLSNGSYLIQGKTMTGFANSEEDEVNKIVGQTVMPWRIQDAATEHGANYVEGGLWAAYAVRDGRLITGQQQHSGSEVAKLVIQALEGSSNTYVLINGAWLGAWSWDKVTQRLERDGHTVLTPELQGHGSDQTPVSEISLEGYVSAIGKLIEQQSQPVILVGHSMGGIIVSALSERYPERIAGAIYVGAYLLQSGETIAQVSQTAPDSLVGPNMVFAPDYSTVGIKPEAVREVFAADASQADADRLGQLTRPEPASPFQTPLTLTPERYGRVPRRYIKTLQDRAVTPALQDAMLSRVPCERVISMNTSHTPFFSAADELAANIVTLSAASMSAQQ